MQFGEAGRLCSLLESCIYSWWCQGIKAPCHGSNAFVAGEGTPQDPLHLLPESPQIPGSSESPHLAINLRDFFPSSAPSS